MRGCVSHLSFSIIKDVSCRLTAGEILKYEFLEKYVKVYGAGLCAPFKMTPLSPVTPSSSPSHFAHDSNALVIKGGKSDPVILKDDKYIMKQVGEVISTPAVLLMPSTPTPSHAVPCISPKQVFCINTKTIVINSSPFVHTLQRMKFFMNDSTIKLAGISTYDS